MSFARPARCLFCSFSRAATPVTRIPRRQFHPATALLNEKPKVPDINASKTQAVNTSQPEKKPELKPEDFKEYTEEEKAALAKEYSKAQMDAVAAGEAAIDPKDLADQFNPRQDPLHFRYLDDFSVIEPVIDRHVRNPQSNTDYNWKPKSEEDFAEDLGKYIADMPDEADNIDFMRFLDEVRVTRGKEENELKPHSALVPELFGPGETVDEPRIEEQKSAFERGEKERSRVAEEMSEGHQNLLMTTGYTSSQAQNIRTKVLVSHSVVNQTRLGKIRRQYCLAVAGNQKGLLGIGESKSDEGTDANIQAKARAIRNMQPVPRYENRTVYGDLTGKVGAVELKLMHRPPGFGLRVQYLIWEMCRAAGIRDLSARVNRSRNPMNTVKATYKALMSQRDPEEIARARGKKIVDVRKVYYANQV
ncbi:37S ribosomal protein S5 [Penicillium alfredii]|uniref:Small ribosomal subunit protein uS5m n=1 Tax=Penicillium alfredii TaxID=1506179 RepID=A0A9W9ERH0_9EURO|nr:37S ribosomal protein S5 [Penicillium alfredii]KAJ5086530.1 37S ribosomal protein S5 [Penicillium alfredii]